MNAVGSEPFAILLTHPKYPPSPFAKRVAKSKIYILTTMTRVTTGNYIAVVIPISDFRTIFFILFKTIDLSVDCQPGSNCVEV